MQFNFKALGTVWYIEIWDSVSEKMLHTIAEDAYQTVINFEKKFSRFQADSLISLLNTHRKIDTSDEEFLSVITYGKSLYTRTDGIFNILVGHTLTTRGYGKALYPESINPEIPGNPSQHIELQQHALHLHGHAHIDIGGFGKGWLIDTIAILFKSKYELKEFLINGGGDMYATHQNNQPVDIYLEDPNDPKNLTKTVHLKHQALAGSSPHKRTWKQHPNTKNEREQNHIVTQTNTPLKDGVYILADTAVAADAFATTLLQVENPTAQALAKAENFTIL